MFIRKSIPRIEPVHISMLWSSIFKRFVPAVGRFVPYKKEVASQINVFPPAPVLLVRGNGMQFVRSCHLSAPESIKLLVVSTGLPRLRKSNSLIFKTVQFVESSVGGMIGESQYYF